MQRWLSAPLQLPDGTLAERNRGTPQGSAVSPVLANLFMHYAFDSWLVREFPSVEFERYADDAVVHCVTERQVSLGVSASTPLVQGRRGRAPAATASSRARSARGVAPHRAARSRARRSGCRAAVRAPPRRSAQFGQRVRARASGRSSLASMSANAERQGCRFGVVLTATAS